MESAEDYVPSLSGREGGLAPALSVFLRFVDVDLLTV
jgi:hypothetical protein